eukprot:7254877-Pyramimonas_sp.AAC.1
MAEKRGDQANAPMTAVHGASVAEPLMSSIPPKRMYADVSKHPVVASSTDKLWFFGYLATFVGMDFETGLFGSARYYVKGGNVKLIFIKGVDLLSHLGYMKDVDIKSRALTMLLALKQDDAKALIEKGMHVFTTTAAS